MIVLPGRVRGLTVDRIWFWDGGAPVESSAELIRYLRLSPEQTEALGGHTASDAAYTLVSDLTEEEEVLWGRLNKNYRYEIRRAQKDGVLLSEYRAEDLRRRPEILESFEKTYMDFCEQLKNEDLKKDFSSEKIASYMEHDCILVTKAALGNAVVYHLYVADARQAVLCYSASDFRDPSVDQAAAARMNKLLHWQDMMGMKKAGLKVYDWGNVSSFEQYNGIDKFKAGFGGEQKTLFNVFVGNGVLGKMAVAARRLTAGG